MNALSMAIGGGFFGTATALTFGFFLVRYHLRSTFAAWLDRAQPRGLPHLQVSDQARLKHDD